MSVERSAVTATRGARMTEGKCEAECDWWAAFSTDSVLIERTAWSATEVRDQAKAHTRETGHPTTVSSTDETRYAVAP